MTVYELIKEVEELTPHSMSEVKSKVMMPTYRFVTSANFALGLIVVAILLATMFLHNAYAYTQETVDKNGVKNVMVNDLAQENTSRVTFDYCLNKYSIDTVGALIVSDLDVVPVPIEPDNVKYRDCVTYGAKVLAESDVVKVSLFQQETIDALVSSFNAKVHDLKNELAQVNQKINEYKKLDYRDDDKVHHLNAKAQLLESQIKSAQSGLKTLIAMEGS